MPSRRLRRVVFILTTLERPFDARDVADLWHADDADLVWHAFPDAALKATRRLALEASRRDRRHRLILG